MTTEWYDLDPIWRECFRLAWEAFQVRSIPVGAVLTDPAGRIIGRGRNRRAENAAPAGEEGPLGGPWARLSDGMLQVAAVERGVLGATDVTWAVLRDRSLEEALPILWPVSESDVQGA